MTSPSQLSPSLVRQITRDEVPEGLFLLADHFPFVVTPLSCDFNFGRHLPQGMAIGFSAYSLNPAVPEFIIIDGHVYGGVVPPDPATPQQIAEFEAKARAQWDRTALRQWHDEVHPAILAEIQRLRAVDLGGLSAEAVLEHIRKLSDRVTEWYGVHFANGRMTTPLLARLRFFGRDHLGMDDSGFLELLSGVSTGTSEARRLLNSLAAAAQQHPPVLAALETPDPWASPVLREHLRPYLEAHGHTALDQADYVIPTMGEQPQRIVQLFREAIAAQAQSQPGGVSHQPDASAAQLRDQLADPALRAEFDVLLAEARDAYAVKDIDNDLMFQAMGLLRYALLEAGRRLAQQGVLADPEQVWFLRRDEFETALAGHAADDLAGRAAARQETHTRQQTQKPPARFGGAPPAFPPTPTGLSPAAQWVMEASAWSEGISRRQRGVQQDTPNLLRGRAAAKGQYTGPVRIVRQESDFEKVQQGDVLVSTFTYPSWNVVLGRVRAIVTDEGGLLSHAAIVAREYGIPAVVGTRSGTSLLSDGQVVTVDGAAGTVQY